ncbi:exodeoxyribonuclease iii [Stylonychia lemnae]|uniref:DNA-(apurinic or apyrimidinic site) endonuclease n=1 Tax=Stylonychia lemnae TaxID=5949 RepID=A0A078A836_STYLE|nr:exodeoxyribonuclease iii [Stylonychia lemnae]|eukprot:CDW77747.1 exodeoxyribonuclease iii [Stylonychia lemnae]
MQGINQLSKLLNKSQQNRFGCRFFAKKIKQPTDEPLKPKKITKIELYNTYQLANSHHDQTPTDYNFHQQDETSIWSWNSNGIRAQLRRGSMQDFLDKYNPDILCLQETKIDQLNIDKYRLFDYIPKRYKQFWNCSEETKSQSGTAVLTKVDPISVSYGMGIKELDQQGRVITLEFQHFNLVNVYIPHPQYSMEYLEWIAKVWRKKFEEYIIKTKANNLKPIVLCGDFNILRNNLDTYHQKRGDNETPFFFDVEIKTFEELLVNAGLLDTYRHLNPDRRQYTYWDYRFKQREQNRGIRIDYLLLDKDIEHCMIDSLIHDEILGGSDHCPLELKLNLKKLSEEANKQQKLIKMQN